MGGIDWGKVVLDLGFMWAGLAALYWAGLAQVSIVRLVSAVCAGLAARLVTCGLCSHALCPAACAPRPMLRGLSPTPVR
jgi:hypothetical protein